jgi:hypothetical protein
MLFIDAADCGTVDTAPVTPLGGVVIGTPEGVMAGRWPAVVELVIGKDVGLTIGVEFGLGVGAVIPVALLAAGFGFTIGLDVGFGFGLEFGFGAGAVVIGVAVAAAGLVDEVAVPFAAALFEVLFVPLVLPLLPLEPVEPALPPFDCANETAATDPISSAAMVFERVFMSPPCRSRTY